MPATMLDKYIQKNMNYMLMENITYWKTDN